MKPRTQFQIRKLKEAESEIRIRDAFAKARVEERDSSSSRSNKRDHSGLEQYLSVRGRACSPVREASEFRCRSYNAAKRVLSYVDHRFVRYPTPLFLYRAVLSDAGLDLIFGQPNRARAPEDLAPPHAKYIAWFECVAQGGSFAKLAKSELTKREAHEFLQAPHDLTIEQCLLWAKFVVAGVPYAGARFLLDKIQVDAFHYLGARFGDFARLYASIWRQQNRNERDELVDYLRAAILEESFSFQGRTLGSIRKLAFDWHKRSYGRKIQTFVSWTAQFPSWQGKYAKETIFAVELTTNRDLAEEGNRQHHCVFLYSDGCARGRVCVFSLRWNYAGIVARHRVTVEVDPQRRMIVQIRGQLNRPATDDEMSVVKLWAAEVGLVIWVYAG